MLISTDKSQKFGYYRKTYTGFGDLNAYYYYFRLKSGSRLRLKAPDNKSWSVVPATFADTNVFNYEISNNQKILTIKIKNIPKDSFYLYDFMVKLDGIDTFISFVINRNYEYSYQNAYYNNQIITENYNFYLGYSEYLWYSIEYQNVFHSFSSNETDTQFTLNLSSLILDIENNWFYNTNIYKKPHQSKVQDILNKLNSYDGGGEPPVDNRPGAQIIWNIISPITLFAQWNLEEEPTNDNLTIQAIWTID